MRPFWIIDDSCVSVCFDSLGHLMCPTNVRHNTLCWAVPQCHTQVT